MTTSPQSPEDRITLTFLSVPADAAAPDAAGARTVAAGSVMEWIDKAGFACAVGWSGTYCVTAYVGNVEHRRPILPGSIISVHARLIHTGRTSMHVLVTVSAGSVEERVFTPATTCILVFVAKDASGHTVPVPAWEPSSEADRRLAALALERIPARQEIKAATDAMTFSEAGTGPRTMLRFLAPPSAVNWGGNAHGGTVLRWIDEAAFACAAGWSGGTPVGVYSGGIHFLRPVRIGDLVEVEARLIHTTEHSMHLSVLVTSANPRTPLERTLTTRCMSIFVVPGDDGRAGRVPLWVPASDEDRALDSHARDLIARRAALEPIPAALALAA